MVSWAFEISCLKLETVEQTIIQHGSSAGLINQGKETSSQQNSKMNVEAQLLTYLLSSVHFMWSLERMTYKQPQLVSFVADWKPPFSEPSICCGQLFNRWKRTSFCSKRKQVLLLPSLCASWLGKHSNSIIRHRCRL